MARYTYQVPRSSSTKSGYLPGLDGLRAVAIGGVLIAHDTPWAIHGHSNELWRGYGGWGVQLFFALSGVLICWRMMEEEGKAGRLRLGQFYTRRLFRIQPAAYVYLAIIALLGLAGGIPFTWHYWASAVLSYTNFIVNVATPPGAPALIGHFWTLSVEEHFYLLLSFLFGLVAARMRLFVLAAFLVLLFGAQSLAMHYGHFSPTVSPRRTYWTIQFLLIPSLLTMLIRLPRFQAFVARFVTPGAVACMVGLTMLVNQKLAHRGIRPLLHYTGALDFILYNSLFLLYGFGPFVIAVMLHPASVTTRFLEWKPLRLVGRWSYSIYLWHVLFFIPVYLGTQVHAQVLIALTGRPWKYVATFVAALASYYFVEKPLIRLGHRVAPPVSAGHPDLDSAPVKKPMQILPAVAIDPQH